MAHPVFDEELRNLQSAAISGGFSLAATGFFLSAYISYKIALETAGAALSTQIISDYRMYVWGSKYMAIVFGCAALWSSVRVATQIRRIRKGQSVFVWSEAERRFVLSSDVNRELSLWFKFKRKIRAKIDKWVS